MPTAVAGVGRCLFNAQQPSTCWARAMEKKTTPGNKSVAGRCLGEIPALPDWLQRCSDWKAGEGTKQEEPMLGHQLSSEDLTAGMTRRPKQEQHKLKGIR